MSNVEASSFNRWSTILPISPLSNDNGARWGTHLVVIKQSYKAVLPPHLQGWYGEITWNYTTWSTGSTDQGNSCGSSGSAPNRHQKGVELYPQRVQALRLETAETAVVFNAFDVAVLCESKAPVAFQHENPIDGKTQHQFQQIHGVEAIVHLVKKKVRTPIWSNLTCALIATGRFTLRLHPIPMAQHPQAVTQWHDPSTLTRVVEPCPLNSTTSCRHYYPFCYFTFSCSTDSCSKTWWKLVHLYMLPLAKLVRSRPTHTCSDHLQGILSHYHKGQYFKFCCSFYSAGSKDQTQHNNFHRTTQSFRPLQMDYYGALMTFCLYFGP